MRNAEHLYGFWLWKNASISVVSGLIIEILDERIGKGLQDHQVHPSEEAEYSPLERRH